MDSSRALCVYHIVVRMAEDFSSLEGQLLIEKRRIRSVPLVSKLKDLFTVYWNHLDDRQKEYVRNDERLIVIYFTMCMNSAYLRSNSKISTRRHSIASYSSRNRVL